MRKWQPHIVVRLDDGTVDYYTMPIEMRLDTEHDREIAEWVLIGHAASNGWDVTVDRHEVVLDERWFVTLYATSQHYGGPEEGGWYYDRRVPISSRQFATRSEAEAEADRLRNAMPDPTDRSAMIPEGESPYRDTEGYIPTGFAVQTANDVWLEMVPGQFAAHVHDRPHYE